MTGQASRAPLKSTIYHTLGLALEGEGKVEEALSCIEYAKQTYLRLNDEPNPENVQIMDMHIDRLRKAMD